MKRVLTATFVAATFAVGLSAQTPTPAPSQPPYPSPSAQPPMADKDAAKSVTVTGCLAAGDTADSFNLSNLKWSDKGKAPGAVGTSGSGVPAAIASATSLKIIPNAATKLTAHIGHTVELTGTISEKAATPPADPAAARPSASGPSFEARSVKMVSDTCTPK